MSKLLWNEKKNILAVHEPDDMLSYLHFLEVGWSKKPMHCWGLEKLTLYYGWIVIGEL